MDYSPEIDAWLKVTRFPTFKGHCGCTLFDLSEIAFDKIRSDTKKALMLYLREPPETDGGT